MTRYLIQETVTPRAVIAMLKDPHDRTPAVRPIFESVGAKLEHYWIAYNENTAYLVVDIPDLEALAVLLTAFMSSSAGSHVKATPVYTATEMVDVLKKTVSLGCQPPKV